MSGDREVIDSGVATVSKGEVVIPVSFALLASLLGTGGFWVIGAYAWTLFVLPAVLLGTLVVWTLRRAKRLTRFGFAITLSSCWTVSGVLALLINIGFSIVQQGTYDPSGLGQFWFVWILSPVGAIITTVLRAVRGRRSNS